MHNCTMRSHANSQSIRFNRRLYIACAIDFAFNLAIIFAEGITLKRHTIFSNMVYSFYDARRVLETLVSLPFFCGARAHTKHSIKHMLRGTLTLRVCARVAQERAFIIRRRHQSEHTPHKKRGVAFASYTRTHVRVSPALTTTSRQRRRRCVCVCCRCVGGKFIKMNVSERTKQPASYVFFAHVCRRLCDVRLCGALAHSDTYVRPHKHGAEGSRARRTQVIHNGCHGRDVRAV